MDTVVIAFSDVGPRKLAWRATLPRPLTWHGLMREIRKHKALMSQDVSFDENGGIYVGAVRRVGNWTVEVGSAVAAVDPHGDSNTGNPSTRVKN